MDVLDCMVGALVPLLAFVTLVVLGWTGGLAVIISDII